MTTQAPAATRATASTTGRVDVHAHHIPDFYRSALADHGIAFSGGFPIPSWSPSEAKGFMDRYGIAAQVVSISEPGVSFLTGNDAIALARRVNDYAAGLIQDEPTRFGALAVLPMPDVPASIAEIGRSLDVLHLDGIGLLSSYDGAYLGDPQFDPVLAELDRRGAYVFLHPSAPPDRNKPNINLPDFLYEFTFDTTRAVTNMLLAGCFARYPRIRWQLAHSGGTIPMLSHRLQRLSQTYAKFSVRPGRRSFAPNLRRRDVRLALQNLYYDTGLASAPESMRATVRVTDLSHVLFGTDWPFAGLTFLGSGDPQPLLAKTFTAPQRATVDRTNALKQLPRLARTLGGVA